MEYLDLCRKREVGYTSTSSFSLVVFYLVFVFQIIALLSRPNLHFTADYILYNCVCVE